MGRKQILKLLGFSTLVVAVVFVFNVYQIKQNPNTTHFLQDHSSWLAGNATLFRKLTLVKNVEFANDMILSSECKVPNFTVKEASDDEVKNSWNQSLDFIPPVPAVSIHDIVPFISNHITESYLCLPKRNYTERIIILSPIRNVENVFGGYVDMIAKLSYPHDLISVYFGEDGSKDQTFARASEACKTLETEHSIHKALALKFNITGGIGSKDWFEVHVEHSQFDRRSHLAKARNFLLKSALELADSDYILWLDSDVGIIPTDIIQQLLVGNSDVVTTSSLYKNGKHKHVFDRNSWRETKESLEAQEKLADDALVLEGYHTTRRIFLPDLKAEGRVVPLDGVGGCALMIKTACHRKGLQFPEKLYKHHLETEGLAKMAKDMGFSVNGLPWVEVVHL